jgi:hypothetical protein
MNKLFAGLLAFLCAAATAQVSEPTTKPTAQSPSTAMPAGKIFVDTTTFPKARPGHHAIRVRPNCVGSRAACEPLAPVLPGINAGDFRVACHLSHVSFDDPIVWPGQAGRTHGHMFFGNTATSSASDVANMHTTGNSTCSGGWLNRSGYWTPFVVKHRPGFAEDGKAFFPSILGVYYKTNGFYDDNPERFNIVWPTSGHRMIAGLPSSTVAVNPKYGGFDCFDGGSGGDGITRQFDHIPTTAEAIATGTNNCQVLIMRVNFPHCWDGASLGGALGFGHMDYDSYVWEVGCTDPAFPVHFVQISFNMFFSIPDINDFDYLYLSSDFPATYGYPKGSTLHGDWVNGWSTLTDGDWLTGLTGGKTVTDVILDQCTILVTNCEIDLLGNPVASEPTTWYRMY